MRVRVVEDNHPGPLAGSVGYLPKDNVLRPEVLEDAQRVAGGGTFVDPMLLAAMVTADASLAILSNREEREGPD